VFGSGCTYTVSYDGTAAEQDQPVEIDIVNGYSSLAPSASQVLDYQLSRVLFYMPERNAACSPPSSLTIPVPTIETDNGSSVTNGPATC